MDVIIAISKGPTYDREFINKLFAVLFSEKYLTKLIENGMSREQILSHIRDTNRCATMKGKNIL